MFSQKRRIVTASQTGRGDVSHFDDSCGRRRVRCIGPCISGGRVRVLAALSVFVFCMTGALPCADRNLIVAEPASAANSTETHYSVVKSDREQVHQGEFRLASLTFD